jgi:spermidine synthase
VARTRLLALAFVLGGAAALIEELAWTRLLARLLGSHASASALVLAVFMAGLALGAPLGARLARRGRPTRPWRTFAALEAAIGAWALVSPLVLERLAPVPAGWPRLLAAALVLLPPTLCMGATFPLMGRLTIESAAAAGQQSAAFYAQNTFGAALGVLAAAFALFPWLGLTRALGAAALLDWIAAALLAAIGGVGRAPEQSSLADVRPTATPKPARPAVHPALASACVLGAAALALEVLLTRLLIVLLGASTYAFALVLAAFLAGIALGSAAARRALARGAPDAGAVARGIVARSALLVPVAVAAGLELARWQVGEASLFGALQNRLPADASPLAYFALVAFLASITLAGAAALFGAALPAAAAWLTSDAARRGGPTIEAALARVYAWNTGGAAVGSLAAGFWLLPRLGLAWSVAIALASCWAVGSLAARRASWTAALGLAACAWLALAAWRRPAAGPAAGTGEARLLLHTEGRDATIDVEERSEAGLRVRSLRVNGNPEASSAPVDLRLQRGLALVPAALHGAPRRALVIGLGSGMTAGTLLAWPELERLDVFELSAEVVPAARLFAEWNLNVADDPRARIAIGDGRHRLALANERWDLISADPVHPWTRGANDLYSLEHFTEIAAHLAPGGVASQWLPLYQLSMADVRTVAATWCAAFPVASAWCTAYDLVLVGANAPLERQTSQASWWSAELPEDARALARAVGWDSALELAALQVADRAALLELAAGEAPMRDDLPVLEFRAPWSYLAGYCEDALAWCARADGAPYVPEPARAEALALRALTAEFLRALPSGRSRAVAEYGARLLAR